ncbi:hypothetical protein MPSEU_000990500 [Mayamaea pseudoterrestris]|nr:hypothetical protein MPSEU_000990500 [Mayamaea pseudoterrestris]
MNGEINASKDEMNKIDASTAPTAWTVCKVCRGQGRINRRPARKAMKRSDEASNGSEVTATKPSQRHVQICKQCQGAGIVKPSNDSATANVSPSPNHLQTFPNGIAIIGGGLAGLALATACRHRNIPCRVYERDSHFSDRTQGYGLTLQQASKALIGFGIESLANGIVSTKHIVHKTDGTIIGEWGFRQWGRSEAKQNRDPKRQNVHIARQALRRELLQAAGSVNGVEWNHKLVSFKEEKDHVSLKFQVGNHLVEERADLLVGADGIRSVVRNRWIGDASTPLQYLGCMVLLGICSLHDLDETVQQSDLLDGATVFQTANGETRIYMMPYSKREYMWQLSFPMEEVVAMELGGRGPAVLKQEALTRCQSWHQPIPQIIEATPDALVSGYPVYDRSLLTSDKMDLSGRVTLIGDACHPMSPFKGQGANQAMLDALQLARALYMVNDIDALAPVLQTFEREMLERSAVKVRASAQAAHFLHSEIAIQQGNMTRGAAAAAASKS